MLIFFFFYLAFGWILKTALRFFKLETSSNHPFFFFFFFIVGNSPDTFGVPWKVLKEGKGGFFIRSVVNHTNVPFFLVCLALKHSSVSNFGGCLT
jgi:hypothetical protein